VAAQEIGHRGAEVETQRDLARPAQDEHEAHEGADGATDGELAEVAPVRLRLFAGERAQAEVSLGNRPGSVAGHDGAEVIALTWVASLPDHVVQAAGPQRWILSQCLDDERDEGVDDRCSQVDPPRMRRGLGENAPNS